MRLFHLGVVVLYYEDKSSSDGPVGAVSGEELLAINSVSGEVCGLLAPFPRGKLSVTAM